MPASWIPKQRELSAVRRRLDALETHSLLLPTQRRFAYFGPTLKLRRRDLYSKMGEIEEIEKQITGNAEDELQGLRREYDSVVRQIAALEDGVRTPQRRRSPRERQLPGQTPEAAV